MAKKTGKKKPLTPPVSHRESRAAPLLERQEGGEPGKPSRLWLAALTLIIAGYLMLRKVDPGGQNAWAVAAPACLLAGYLLIIPAITRTYRS